MRRGAHLFLAILAALLIASPQSLFAADQGGADKDSPQQLAASVGERITQLDSGTTDARRAAANWLINTPPKALPLIEAAAEAATTNVALSERLRHVLATLRPLDNVRSKVEQLRGTTQQWNKSTALTAYMMFGRKNPAWNLLAQKGISQYLTGDLAGGMETLEHVTTDLKCDDPLVLYFDARVVQKLEQAQMIGPVIATYAAACKGFETSGYPADRKCFAMLRMIDFVKGTNIEKMNADAMAYDRHCADKALELWPQVLAEPGLPDAFAVEIGDSIIAAQMRYGADRGQILKQLLPPMYKAYPHSAVPYAFEGSTYVTYAWDARGSGWANTVTPEGWKLMAERLDIAAAALTKAYEINPSDPVAPTAMLAVELGQGHGKDIMEKWFARAIAANQQHFGDYPYAGHADAYASKLNYLLPRWHGSAAEMLTFGRQCAATHNWWDNVSWVLIDAHTMLSQEAADPVAYWQRPEVWSDVRSVVSLPLDADPQNNRLRSDYAYWAFRCGQWKLADEQFKLLGDKIDTSFFGGDEAYKAARDQAATKPAD